MSRAPRQRRADRLPGVPQGMANRSGGSSSEPDLASRIGAQGRVYDALTAEAHLRFTLQHQLVVVSVALAGAGATFLPKLVTTHPATGDFLLDAGFIALLIGFCVTAYTSIREQCSATRADLADGICRPQ